MAYLFLVRRQDRINLGLTNESSRSGRWGKMIASLNVAQSQSGQSLLGTWRLVSYEARDSQGRVHYPLGENVSGLLVYDGGGNMSAHVMRNDRPFFAARDPARGTDAELRAAFEDYGSYSAPTLLTNPRKL